MLRAERKGDTLTVWLEGELDECSSARIRGEADELLSDARIRRLVLDMEKLTFMDSSGIGVILGRYRALASRGGEVVVRGMNARVERIFDMSGLGQIVSAQRREEV